VLFVPGWSWARQVEKVSSVATALVMDNRKYAAVLCAGVGRGAPVVTLQDAGHLCWIERAKHSQRHHHANGHGSMT
jgi:hypothetical protein